MFFTYWTNATSSAVPARQAHFDNMVADWSSKFSDFRAFTDADVEPLLDRIDPDLGALFRRINIPSCKADIARLVLLHEHGGFYIDAHASTDDAFVLARIMERLSSREMVLFDKNAVVSPQSGKHIVNGAIAARRGAETLKNIIGDMRDNLFAHFAAEQATDEHVPYNIFLITGAYSICNTLFNPGHPKLDLKPHYEDKVYLESIQPPGAVPLPFVFYRYYGYREPGKHWSERQNSERLFI